MPGVRKGKGAEVTEDATAAWREAQRVRRLQREIERLQRLTRLGVLAAADTDPQIAELESLLAGARRAREKAAAVAWSENPIDTTRRPARASLGTLPEVKSVLATFASSPELDVRHHCDFRGCCRGTCPRGPPHSMPRASRLPSASPSGKRG